MALQECFRGLLLRPLLGTSLVSHKSFGFSMCVHVLYNLIQDDFILFALTLLQFIQQVTKCIANEPNMGPCDSYAGSIFTFYTDNPIPSQNNTANQF